MANVLKHRFTSGKPDGADATQIQPSHWNDGHLFTGGNTGEALTRDPADPTFGATWQPIRPTDGVLGDVLTRDPTVPVYGAKWQTPAVPPAATDTVLLPTTPGTVHDWAPGLSGHTFIQWVGAADLMITGLAGGVSGQRVTISHQGSAGVIRLAHQSTSSAAVNRFQNAATSAPTPIALGGWATYVYGSVSGVGTWIQIDHQQGSWITPAHNAADFTASGSMIWTVEAGDVLVHQYCLVAKTLLWSVDLYVTTVGGTLSNRLDVTFPAGFTAPNRAGTGIAVLNDNGVETYGALLSTGNKMGIYRVPATNFTASTNNTSVRFAVQVPIS